MPHDHGGAAGDGESALEHGLGAARGEDSGEGPAGEREDLLVAAGGEEDGVGAYLCRGLLLGALKGVHGEGVARATAAGRTGLPTQPPFHQPHMMFRQVRYAARLHVFREGVTEPLPRPPLVVQGLRASGVQSGGGLSVELAARPRRRVDQGDADAVGRGGDRGGEPRRARADHREVRSVVSHRDPSPPAYGWRLPGAQAPGKPVGSGGR